MAEPKKETVRVAFSQTPEIAPGPLRVDAGLEALRILEPAATAGATNGEKTPLQVIGSEIAQMSPILVAPSGLILAFDSIPKWFCWSLLGISALIFLVEIWNYTLS